MPFFSLFASSFADLFLVQAAEYALERGIIIADTKFEFGIDHASNSVVLVDEVLTPDSSRFWPAASYEVGRPQKSLDKVRQGDVLPSSNTRKADHGV